MKTITLPPPVTVLDRSFSGSDIIREIILCRPNWRKSGNVKVALRIETYLDEMIEKGENSFTCSDREHELLLEEAALQSQPLTLSPVQLNRYYLRVLDTLYDAKTEQG